MTGRPHLLWHARAYLVVMAVRFGVLGSLALFAHSLVATPALLHPVPAGLWGGAFVVMAVAAMAAAVYAREVPFRYLIVASFALTAAFSGRLVVGLATGDLRYVVAPVFGVSLALSDLIVSSMQVTEVVRAIVTTVAPEE